MEMLIASKFEVRQRTASIDPSLSHYQLSLTKQIVHMDKSGIPVHSGTLHSISIEVNPLDPDILRWSRCRTLCWFLRPTTEKLKASLKLVKAKRK